MLRPHAFALCIVFSLCAGCTTLPSSRGWGEDATIAPGWERVRVAARNAAIDPWVWAPLIGAAALQIDDWDERSADWARKHTPIFGSQPNAERWSDDLRDAASIAHYASVVFAPSGDAPAEWLWNKTKGTLVHVAAVSATSEITLQLKDWTNRERPNGLARESFPSGHTSAAAVHTRLASRTLDSIQMSTPMRTTLEVGLHAITIGTSWARIEAGWHYPSDTLAAMALGNFLGSFFNDAFLGLDTNVPTVQLRAVDGGAMIWFATVMR